MGCPSYSGKTGHRRTDSDPITAQRKPNIQESIKEYSHKAIELYKLAQDSNLTSFKNNVQIKASCRL